MKEQLKTDYDYLHTGENFIHNDFEFKYGEYYRIDQDEYHVYLMDDNDDTHLLSYKEAEDLLGVKTTL